MSESNIAVKRRGVPSTEFGAPRQRRRARRFGRAIPVLLLVVPIAIYEIFFVLYPIVSGVQMSFTDSRLGSSTSEFVGTKNYDRLFANPDFYGSLLTTLIYSVCVVAFAVGFGLCTALLVNRRFRGRGIVRGIMTMPWAFPEVALVLIFIWIFNPSFGVINYLAPVFPWLNFEDGWLTSSPLSMVAIIMMSTWKNFPFYSVVLLAALQTVPEELHEAARVDGASPFQRFRSVTLPALAPTLTLLGLLAFIFSFKQFTIIYLTTGGGPARSTETLVIQIYTNAFKYFNYSYAAAIGTMCLVVTLLVTVAYMFFQRRVDRLEG